MKSPTQRIDVALVEKGLAQSREGAKRLVMSGRVLVNDIPVDKPGTQIAANAALTIKGEDIPYVSRGGLKLEKALVIFDINPKGLICMDVGASTGGFTDCLLQGELNGFLRWMWDTGSWPGRYARTRALFPWSEPISAK